MSPTCARSAWLVLGSSTVLLEDPTHGYFCTSLDLGFPVPRDVTTNRPDQDGTDDRTQYSAGRVVSANITALVGAGARIDAIAGLFAPFMLASARPQLHYILDRPGVAERVMTVRATGFSWPIVGNNQRDLQLQFITSDPAALDANTTTATAWSGSISTPGRLYPLVFPRVYPVGGGVISPGTLAPHGDLPIKPHLRIYGPITGPQVTFTPQGAGQNPATAINFQTSYIINDGHFVDVDTVQKIAILDGDPTQPVQSSINWQTSSWPVINPVPPAASGVNMNLNGGSTSASTTCLASWQDRYLT